MNLPNKLTITRIVMTIFIIFILLFPFYMININFPKFYVGELLVDSKYFVAGVLFLIASVTDFIDGYIARKYDLITNLGKMLDAIADKILVNSILIILATNGFINPIIPVVIVLRDTFVDAIKMEAASKGKVVAAIKTGKLKTASLMAGIVLMLFYNLPFELIGIRLADFLLYFATILSIVSMIEYYVMNKKYIFNKENN